jgi:hypothetical protein
MTQKMIFHEAGELAPVATQSTQAHTRLVLTAKVVRKERRNYAPNLHRIAEVNFSGVLRHPIGKCIDCRYRMGSLQRVRQADRGMQLIGAGLTVSEPEFPQIEIQGLAQ